MRYSFLFSLVLSMAVLSAGSLRADTFVVNTFLDDPPANDGVLSLREAIIAANGNNGDDTITFAANLDQEVIFLDQGTLVITDTTGKTTIDASSLPNGIFVDGFGFSLVRVFRIALGADVEMRNLEITSGAAPDGTDGGSGANPAAGGDGEHGGGIYNEGTLVLYDCRITGNRSGHGGRGGDVIGNAAGFSGIGGNGGNGGGIYSTGDQASVTLFDCLVSGNDAGNGGTAGNGDVGTPSDGGDGGSGGGIFSDDRSKLRVVRSLITNNDAGVGGTGGLPASGDVGGTGGDGGNGGGVAMSLPVQVDDGAGTFFPFFEDSEFSQNNKFGGVSDAAIGGAGGDDTGSTDDIGGAGGNGGNGGALWVENFVSAGAGTVHVDRSLFVDNESGSGADGGDHSSDNSTDGTNGGDAGSGGAVYVTSSLGTNQVWSMQNCTVTTNECGNGGDGGDGGASGTGGDGGAAGNGGGLAFAQGPDDYTAELVHLTIYNNSAGTAGSGGTGSIAGIAGDDGSGGGVWDDEIVFLESGVVFLNTIVSLNSATTDKDISGGQASGSGNNLVGDSPDPMLDPLENSGGSTRVHAPLIDSPAIDGGTTAAAVSIDQRGFPRPRGGAPDIGAVEIGFQPDIRIGKRSNPATHKINNYYNASAVGQNYKIKLAGRRRGKAFFSVESDSDIPETITVRGTKPNRSLRVKVFRLTGGRANVAGALIAGFPIANMEPGSTVIFQIDAKARSKKRKPRQNLTYSARSQVVPSADAVRLQVRPKKGGFL